MPFVRLIIPFIIGILLQRYVGISLLILFTWAIIAVLVISAYYLFSLTQKYRYRWLPGIAVYIALITSGAFMVCNHDIRNQPAWIGNYLGDSIAVLATLQEPLVEKAKTYKAEATIDAVFVNSEWKESEGKVLIYVSKEDISHSLNYGSQILFYKALEEIKNSGNPGAFDYKQYSAYQNIYHQVFLNSSEYSVANTTNRNAFKNWLFCTRDRVIAIIQQFIKGSREAGVAEALLIGYRNDLDRDLVQAYSNTGVVHIIAISGLHLGMIYIVLVWLLKPLKRTKTIRLFKPIIVVTVLWAFTFLAGAVPSIMRSAVMFSFIVLGEAINRKASIYNILASSAFVMLCINPYYLWDVGFQLSYAAVISIVTFQKPVYDWFYIQNKLIDFFWKLTSVTIAAQVLTLPIIFYTFHQFPNLFLITNCLIVPWSTIILFAELALILFSSVPLVAKFIGSVTGEMLSVMNNFIERLNSVSFAVYDGIQINIAQVVLLYIFIICLCYWLLFKAKTSFFVGLAALLAFVIIDSYDIITLRQQQKVIVYNISKHCAIDFISGLGYSFVGDSDLIADDNLVKFNLDPSRRLQKVKLNQNLEDLYVSQPFMQFHGKRILLIDKPFKFENQQKIRMDIIIVAHSPRLYISDVAKVFDCKQYVFDGSNSAWKIKQWKKDCDSLHLRHYSTGEQGAFILNL